MKEKKRKTNNILRNNVITTQWGGEGEINRESMYVRKQHVHRPSEERDIQNS